jgi:hypothetical protein
MLVAVASMGAASYASNGAQQAAATFTSVFGFRGNDETTSRRPPPGDDQYDEQCKEQFKQRLKEEEETHKANLRNARTRQEREAEYRRHQRATALIMFEFKRCRGKRGNDHNEHGHGDNEHDD